MRIFVLSCSNEKIKTVGKAEDVYCSKNFLNSLNIAKTCGDMFFIVSGRYGLLLPDQLIEPYDFDISMVMPEEQSAWARKTWESLENVISCKDKLIFLTNPSYSELLQNENRETRTELFFPFLNKSSDYRENWLHHSQPSSKRVKHISELYNILSDLSNANCGNIQFNEFNSLNKFPKQGLYFFFESDQNRSYLSSEKRVVRVGTHGVSKGSKSLLWTRLRTHRGTGEGSGNHRSSIFRLHVGSAIIKKMGLDCPTWGKGQSASKEIREKEAGIESLVSEFLRKMSFSWLNIPGEASAMNDRAYIEQNVIALLSGPIGPLDVGSNGWLGYFASHPAVSQSSLWNVNHVNQKYDQRFLEVLARYSDFTTGKKNAPAKPLAPRDWKMETLQEQRDLFSECV